jgi:hypothetical protein
LHDAVPSVVELSATSEPFELAELAAHAQRSRNAHLNDRI